MWDLLAKGLPPDDDAVVDKGVDWSFKRHDEILVKLDPKDFVRMLEAPNGLDWVDKQIDDEYLDLISDRYYNYLWGHQQPI